MFRIVVCLALLCAFGSAFAQPRPLGPPPGWPDLTQNSDGPPSCIFGTTLGPSNTPAYFCAVIIRATGNDPDPNVQKFQGGVAGFFVNPTTGAVTPAPSFVTNPTNGATIPTSVMPVPRQPPAAIGCVLIGNTPNCLFYPFKAANDIGVLKF